MGDNSVENESDSLIAALSRHSFELPAEQTDALDRYVRRVWEWNTRLNLTRHTTYERFVVRDIADSLQLAKLLAPNERVLDVGTGAGVPGAVIAILRPDLTVELSESVAKKAKALAAIVEEAGVSARVHHSPAQQIVERQRFDTLLVRAVAPLAKLLIWFKPHWPNVGRLLVIKGPQWTQERAEARQRNLLAGLELRKAAVYPLADTSAESVVLQIRPASKAAR